ncbi:protein-L-isoaspartate(D-aspartate) O-methyltransferase [Endozoicomonas numazuensis]|uniref:Protein-L-isoaspartate O-methyltransferase n=1 Tax=Endozoicomonas numazuensis TaxID=1137799 RepID=A0A081NH63_9GAMM|nr:protein-L-isoaspartate(D-aspartate) O-methyltransferase [Endozoicomonas numazuensis]KEQ17786.1 protein-L-isoaspartate O-methyltransferase [Endozoicomonas numazuensis]
MKDVDIDGIGMTSRRTRDRLIQRLKEQGIKSPAVLEVIRNAPRHLFVDEALSHRAYEDTALPIGFGQTLSQPYIVARMTEALMAAGPLGRVLEIGTGSGYQTAVLSPLVKKVYSVERIKALNERAKKRLRTLNIRNAQLKLSDGAMGWPVMGPFDGIIVTAAPDQMPEELLQQMSENNGRLVIPVGDRGVQDLLLITRQGDTFKREVLEAVRFVPLLDGIQK